MNWTSEFEGEKEDLTSEGKRQFEALSYLYEDRVAREAYIDYHENQRLGLDEHNIIIRSIAGYIKANTAFYNARIPPYIYDHFRNNDTTDLAIRALNELSTVDDRIKQYIDGRSGMALAINLHTEKISHAVDYIYRFVKDDEARDIQENKRFKVHETPSDIDSKKRNLDGSKSFTLYKNHKLSKMPGIVTVKIKNNGILPLKILRASPYPIIHKTITHGMNMIFREMMQMELRMDLKWGEWKIPSQAYIEVDGNPL